MGTMGNKDLANNITRFLFLVVSLMVMLLILQSLADFVTNLIILESHLLLDKILYIIILVEILHLSLMYPFKSEIDPQEVVMVVLIASARKLITNDIFKEDPAKILAVSGVLLVCIYGIKVLRVKKAVQEVNH